MAVLDLGKVVPEKGTDYFTEQDIEEIVSEVKSEITIPTKTSDLTNDSGFIDKTVNDLTNYELKTNTGATIELSINSSTYVMTMVLKNSSGTALSTQTVDLPLESVVVSGSYDNTNKKIVLTLQNGSTIDVPVGDLVSGLQSEITNNNKLSSDLVDDTNHINLFVTASEKTIWNGKQDTLTAGDNITIENNVISASGGEEHYLGNISDYSSSNRINLNDLDVGMYHLYIQNGSYGTYNFYFKASKDGVETTLDTSITTTYSTLYNDIELCVYDKISDIVSNQVVLEIHYILLDFNGNKILRNVKEVKYNASTNTLNSPSVSTKTYKIVSTDTAQTISGVKTFSVLPESSVTPTTNNQLVNKSYVDSAITSAITTTLGGSY